MGWSVLFVAAALLAVEVAAEAQQPKKVPLIGYVSTTGDPSIPGPQFEAFRQGLRDLGYIEGKNILVEYRYARESRNVFQALWPNSCNSRSMCLSLGTLTVIRAAKQATKTIPIVMVTTADPVATGLVDSLARPGGNITGLTRLSRELSGKRLELLKEVVPGISRVGVLRDADDRGAAIAFKEYEAAARALKIALQSLEVRGLNPDFEGAFQAAAKGRANSLIAIRGPLLRRYRKRIADLAIKNRLPSMYEGNEYVEAGGLMSYAANDAEQFRRAAIYVDKILKGTKPADLPVEQPTKFEFVINLKNGQADRLDDSADGAVPGGSGDKMIFDFRLPILDWRRRA